MDTIDLSNWPGNKVTVGLVADTHGYLDFRIAEIVTDECDIVAHLGDIGSQTVLDELQPKSSMVFAVVGNNDVPWKWKSTDTSSLETLPNKCLLSLPGGDLAMEHGHEIKDSRRYHELLRKAHPYACAIAYGHTHVRVIDQTEKPWVINPGAAGRERTKGGPSMQILTASSKGWSVADRVFEPLPRR